MRQQETVPDQIHLCKVKLAFIAAFFCRNEAESSCELTGEAADGLYYILGDIREGLDDAYERLTALQKPA